MRTEMALRLRVFMNRFWLLPLLVVILVGQPVGTALAQPPGTTPSTEVFDDQGGEIPIKGFLFLNEAKNRVIMPGLSWEEFERLQNLDNGVESTSGRYAFESLQVSGTVFGLRAEMEVTIKLTIDATGGRFVTIPLRMNNFHRIAPPDVSGIAEYYMTVAEDGSGHQILVRCDSRCDATIKMKVSTRVQSSSARSIDFRLPEVSSRVDILTDDGDSVGEVVGHGDETIQSTTVDKKSTKLSVDSSGGSFTLMWGKPRRVDGEVDSLEVESRVVMQWDSPQDSPIVEVRLTVRNVKGSVERMRVRLPKGSVVLDLPTLGTGGQTVEFIPLSEESDAAESGIGEIYEVEIPIEERQPRIDLNFDLQLAGENATSKDPLLLRVPEVMDAIRHRGELTVQIADDYRLRWKARPWIRSAAIENPEESVSQRQYQFRFDRGSFELPIWLSANERRLRLTSQSTVTIEQSQALLEMIIDVSGPANDGRLRLDDASWQILSVERVGTGEQLEYFTSETLRIIELGMTGTESSFSIKVLAKLPMGQDLGAIQFPVPRVVATGNDVLIRDANLTIVGAGRSLLVVDLEASEGLTRITPEDPAQSSDAMVSRFRLPNTESTAIVAGNLIDQPPRITLSAGMNIEVDGSQAVTTVDWEVTSPLDLGGSLPIRIPGATRSEDAERNATSPELDSSQPESSTLNAITELADDSLLPFDSTNAATDQGWTVTIDGVPGKLQQRSDDMYDLISDRLGRGTTRIRWRHEGSLGTSSRMILPYTLMLPRPAIADVTLRGTIELRLQGNQTSQWVPLDFPNGSKSDDRNLTRLTLDSIPRDPVRLRLQPRLSRKDERYVQRAVLRSAVTTRTRYEQLLASIQGGDEIQISLPSLAAVSDSLEDITVEAFLDGQNVNVNGRDKTLTISLPGDASVHHLDLRIWVARDTSAWTATITPLMKLPVGIGRVYWQLIAPSDSHVIWASPTVGRAMEWRFDKWELFREPVLNDQALTASPTAVPNAALPGTRYLYVGSDLPSFEVVLISRTLLWLIVGSVILLVSVVLTYWPASRHPLAGVVAAIAFAGLLIVATDAAVLVGQFATISLVLVIVMIAIRALVSPAEGGRIFQGRSSSRSREFDTRPVVEANAELAGLAETHSLNPSSHRHTVPSLEGQPRHREPVADRGSHSGDRIPNRPSDLGESSGSQGGSARQSGSGTR
ncbi:hypothetical protein Pla22_44140 [Rubripirellula amarantea]|uniref:Uncharacterized protein n=2 Tax=Rubripirellula amarantea TaxID=2527999 RepID=A0A5C5WHF1_9BACT|nr:hypothetical protein Pla22_44140 [Rubripirellula amarantea]